MLTIVYSRGDPSGRPIYRFSGATLMLTIYIVGATLAVALSTVPREKR